jgi:hypothetical protein
MRKRIVEYATGLFIASVASISSSAVAPQDTGTIDAAKVAAATELARNQLAHELQIDIAGIEALSTAAHTWPDSSLGCGKPGAMASQVMTPGYEVTLKSEKGNYRVHATDKYAVVCGAATQWRNPHAIGAQLKNLNIKIDEARVDLAKLLSAPLNEIHTENFVQSEWRDSSMDCVLAGEQIIKEPAKGYRIALRYAGRIYTYHTDLNRVRACPAIEVN